MRDLETLGIERSSDVTEDIIQRVEARLSVRFPESYKRLVKHAEEAVPECDTFTAGGMELNVSEFLRFSADPTDTNGVLAHSQAGIPGLPVGVIPIARDPGDWLICLDLRGNLAPVLVFDPNERECHPVADSFDDFLEALYSEDGD